MSYICNIDIALVVLHCIVILQNKDLNVDGGTVSAKLPDICLIYKLHLECGRLINLYDWLQVSTHILCQSVLKSAASYNTIQ